MFGSQQSEKHHTRTSSYEERGRPGAPEAENVSFVTTSKAAFHIPRVLVLGCAMVFSGCTLWFGAYDGTPRTVLDEIEFYDGGMPDPVDDAGAPFEDAGIPEEDAGSPDTDAGVPTPDAGPGMIDEDNDGIRDAVDNCPDLANADQMDRDSDTQGDACDPNPDVPDLILSGQSLVISERSSDSEHILDADIGISSVESSDGEFFLMGTLQP